MSWEVQRGRNQPAVEPSILVRAEPTPTLSPKGDVPLGEVSPEVLQSLSAEPKVTGAKAHQLRGRPRPTDDVAVGLAWQFQQLVGTGPLPNAAELEAKAQSLEDRAFEVLAILTPQKIGAAEAAFDTWFTEVEAKSQRGEKLDALEHLTILHILKEQLFNKQPELAAYLPRLEVVLGASDRQFAGKERPLAQALKEGLPRRVIRAESKDAQKIHAAIFTPKEPGFAAVMAGLVKDYVPGPEAALVAAGILASLFSGAGVELLAGAVHGYLLATLIEHAIHEHIGHASNKTLEKLDGILGRFGPIGRAIKEGIESTRFSHAVIHHGSYAGSYVDRFAPREAALPKEEIERRRAEKKATLEDKASARGPADVEQLKLSDYGRKLAHALRNALTVAPVTALVTLFSGAIANAAGADLGGLFLASSVLTSLIFIPASNYLHPYLHMTKEEAFEQAGPVMRRFLETDYVAHVARNHYVHHRDAQVNQNLVAGADYALGYKASGVDVIVALRKLGTFY